MQYGELIAFLENVGKDPSRLIFEDELTGIHNRRFLLSYLEHKVRWDSGDDYPLSILFIDLDQFKEINDTHGHDTGDQVLIWISTLLKEVAGEKALPVRYGGDEFALLLPKMGRHMSREMADRLLQRARDRVFKLRDVGVPVPITLSIGIATAPDDAASSRDLFHAADTALYHAKQSGRDQAATAAEIDPEKVFPKTALHRLNTSGIIGRGEEMAVVSEALEALDRGQSQFLVFEASPGMGKTTLLETIRRNLSSDDTFWETMVVGEQQEAYRPYYLASRILLALLNQRDDKGADILQDLSKEEIGYLSHVLPHLNGNGERSESDPVTQRQGIFATLARFVPRIVDRPLVLLIDDLQFVDEATLLLLRVLIQRQELNLLACGASLEPLRLSDEQEEAPLERFYASYEKELGIRRVKLKPLSENDISEYLHGVFPILKTPPDFEAHLARTTQGNPLFLGEIIRKLVVDRKVNLTGQQWVIEPLGEGYLPHSLEEIVVQKIAALDEESRSILERASTLGEDIPLSVLTGSSELDENKVLEFLDRAEALGLVSLDFQVNDEIMRFLGKQVLQISYGAIDKTRRQTLHEEVGAYQERLYKQRLLPSASLLAYHFKKSANQQKAQRYEQIQLDFSQAVFDPSEAATYTGEILEDGVETEKRLDPAGIRQIPGVLRALMSAVRNIKLYPPESKAITTALGQVLGPIKEILTTDDRLHLSQAQRVLLANGQRIDVSGYQALADSFLELLARTELQGVVFKPGVTGAEIRTLLMTLGDLKPENIDHGFWANFTLESGFQNIELQQMRYSRVRRRKGRVLARRQIIEEEALGPAELAHVPAISRALLGASKNIKLYPLDSEPVSRSIERLGNTLEGILATRETLSLSSVDGALLVNGTKIDTSSYDTIARSLVSFLDSVGLRSVTFFRNVPLGELVAFVDAVRDPAACSSDADFWEDFAKERETSYLAFNQSQYALNVVQTLLGAVEVEIEDEEPTEAAAEWEQQLAQQPSEALRDALPRYGKDFLVKGEHKLLSRLLHRAFGDFEEQEVREREKTILACRVLLEGLILGLQHKFTRLALDPLLDSLNKETEPRVLQELATVLYGMASSAIQFADYQVACRILLGIKDRQRQLGNPEGGEGGEGGGGGGGGGDANLARLMDRKLDATAQKLLEDDLKSGQPDRHERAAVVVGSLGRQGIPLLIEVIKTEKDFRSRQLAASLLAEMGPEAGDELKRALVTEVVVEQRFRILEVVDTITRDLRDELAYSLGDSSPKIRRAAFRLFERLHEDSYIELILPLARHKDIGVTKGAIRSLAHLRSPAAVDAIVSVLEETEDAAAVGVACCQALGEVGHSAGIEPLERVLALRRFPFGPRRWNEEVRSTAAMALKQISHPRSTEVLLHYTNDREVRVRQLARSTEMTDGRRAHAEAGSGD